MLSFSAGELSTIEGPLGMTGLSLGQTQRFNVKDLPCPPQNVMVKTYP